MSSSEDCNCDQSLEYKWHLNLIREAVLAHTKYRQVSLREAFEGIEKIISNWEGKNE